MVRVYVALGNCEANTKTGTISAEYGAIVLLYSMWSLENDGDMDISAYSSDLIWKY